MNVDGNLLLKEPVGLISDVGVSQNSTSKQVGSDIWNRGVPTVMKEQKDGYAARYAATKGFMPIPQSEIDLSNGVLKQNAGWMLLQYL